MHEPTGASTTDEKLARIFVGNDLRLEHAFGDGGPLEVETKVPIASLVTGQKLTFDVEPGGTIFYDARLRFARNQLPSKPVDHGIEIERTLQISSKELVSGDRIVVHVRLITPSERRAVALEIPLPGGLYVPDEQRIADRDAHYPFVKREVRDEGVTYFADRLRPGITELSFVVRARHPGTYVMPPAKAYEMYAPDSGGWTPVTNVVIKP